jgi:ankyrin repeat protein
MISHLGTPLHQASCNGHLEVCRLLLNQGADIAK